MCHTRVQEGATLADAMAKHPRAFGELGTSIVRAGGEGGFLEEALERLARFTEQQDELKSRVIGALAYPAILFIVGTMVVTVLIVKFVPKFEKLFSRLRAKGELPAVTDWLLWLSHVLQDYGIFIVIAASSIVGAARPQQAHDRRRSCLARSLAAESSDRELDLFEPGRVAVLPSAGDAAHRRRADRTVARNQCRLDRQPRALGRGPRGGGEHLGRSGTRPAAGRQAAIFRPTWWK